MSAADYLLSVKKLNNIGRWASDFMHRRASVAEHSFSVAQIAQL
ncbi:MAG: YfbR-like 5'-deoxynucleotidase, partial [Deferribacterales bacterium]